MAIILDVQLYDKMYLNILKHFRSMLSFYALNLKMFRYTIYGKDNAPGWMASKKHFKI